MEANTLVGGIPAKELRPVEERDCISWQYNTKWYTSVAKDLKDPEKFFRIDK